MSPETAPGLRQSKGGEQSVHVLGYFDCYCEFLELLPLLEERNSSTVFLGCLGLMNGGGRIEKREWWVYW